MSHIAGVDRLSNNAAIRRDCINDPFSIGQAEKVLDIVGGLGGGTVKSRLIYANFSLLLFCASLRAIDHGFILFGLC